jgi:hypothetical protein
MEAKMRQPEKCGRMKSGEQAEVKTCSGLEKEVRPEDKRFFGSS